MLTLRMPGGKPNTNGDQMRNYGRWDKDVIHVNQYGTEKDKKRAQQFIWTLPKRSLESRNVSQLQTTWV